MERVAACLEKNDFDGALALFDGLPPAEAELAQNRIAKSTILISAGKVQDARDIVEAVIKDDGSNIEARYVLSVVEGLQKKLRAQRILLEDIVQDSPNFVPALNDLGKIAIEAQKNLKKAASYYDTALKAEPANEDSLIGRARVYRLEKKYDDAFTVLGRGLQFHPKSAVLYSERGRLYRNRGALDEALSDMDTAVKLEPSDYWYTYDRGLVLLDKNRKQEALDDFKRAASIDPNIFISYVYTAGISDELGMYEDAEKYYRKLASIKPDYYFGFEGIGIHSLKKGSYMAARDAFIKAWSYALPEINYALLAAYCWLKAEKNSKESRAQVKNMLNDAIKQIKRDSLEYYVLRMYAEGLGDTDVANRIEKETDGVSKVRALFYLSCYYDLNGLPTLAEKYSDTFNTYNRRDIVEFRINEFLHPDSNVAVHN
ncbi:MAG: tetratricopeptide repeat protein [Spirochaetaceae bacterium]|nr:tetratricopeptide repeat protein [Spirochaetaceae bacterium]